MYAKWQKSMGTITLPATLALSQVLKKAMGINASEGCRRRRLHALHSGIAAGKALRGEIPTKLGGLGRDSEGRQGTDSFPELVRAHYEGATMAQLDVFRKSIFRGRRAGHIPL